MQNNTTTPTSGPSSASVAVRDGWRDPIAALGTGFTGNPLDRCSERRDDLAFVAGLRRDPRARILLFAADAPLVLIPAAANGAAAVSPHAPASSIPAAAPSSTGLTIPLESNLGVSLETIVSAGAESVGIPYVLHETLVRALAGVGFGAGARDHANADEESVLLGIDAAGVPWFSERLDVAPEAPHVTCPDLTLAWTDVGIDADAQCAASGVAAHPDAGGMGMPGTVLLRAVGLRVLAAQGQVTPAELAMLAQAKAVLAGMLLKGHYQWAPIVPQIGGKPSCCF